MSSAIGLSTVLVPTGIWWAATPEAGNIADKGDRTKRRKLWADPLAAKAAVETAKLLAPVVNQRPWWMPAEFQPPMPMFTYRVLARDGSGRLKLTPIGSPDFHATYTSLAVVRTYEQWRDVFPGGVPYLETLGLAADLAGEANGVGTLPAIDYPVSLGANHILQPTAENRVIVWDYQTFSAAMRAQAAGLTDAERRAAIAAVALGGDDHQAAYRKIRELVTFSGNGNVQLT